MGSGKQEHRNAIILSTLGYMVICTVLLHTDCKIGAEKRQSSGGDFNSPDICWKSQLVNSPMSNRSLTLALLTASFPRGENFLGELSTRIHFWPTWKN